MERDYLKEKVVKKKSAVKAAWMMVVFVLVFALLLAKYAFTGSLDPFTGLPDSDVAYSIAKEFIRPTTLSSNVTFSDSQYQFAKKSDSVYVIKSFYTDGEDVKNDFRITLKYDGGNAANKSNWTLVNLDQD
ncbi:hypothetical protein FPZ43_02215 [Mucilaginibacter pallidiroseus]|uniref:Uncharacterized protein n=1 Tax=Mucilaginibacter pallidiroseus TaxID=2599295 RepID=A0A563UIW1_9SPHI|nr:hypothetical protein [Mucilaginibacter pallidiroseus]TWR31312.1 hypothetical protein FPZ43_02215 [Mucilaginibacter pallidiroseus]